MCQLRRPVSRQRKGRFIVMSMIRAAFFGSNLIAGTDLHDPAESVLPLCVSQIILGWEEMNLRSLSKGARHRSATTSDGRILDPASGAARVDGVRFERLGPDVVVLMFGDEDHAASTLVRRAAYRPRASTPSPAYPAVARHERRHLTCDRGTRRRTKTLATLCTATFQEQPGSVSPGRSLFERSRRRGGCRPGTFAGDFDYHHILSGNNRSR